MAESLAAFWVRRRAESWAGTSLRRESLGGLALRAYAGVKGGFAAF